MRAFSGSTVVEQPVASNRRQPIRQTRINPARVASSSLQAQGGASAPTPDSDPNATPGFFPALTHYSDAIAALPKEMIRHNTMLKEVDAKIYGPEARLTELVNVALKNPPPPHTKDSDRAISTSSSMIADASSTNAPIPAESSSLSESLPQPVNDNPSDPSYPRRLQFHNIRTTLYEMLATLDEKNHVINTAIDCLDKQTMRCNSSFPHIQDEISEEARLGSMTHWAYTDKTAERKGMISGERTRRTANAQEIDAAALRSESRREAVAAKKPRNQYLDSDFDDGRVLGRKAPNGGKGRRIADQGPSNGAGLGIVNSAGASNKRRKMEKPTASGLRVKGAMALVYGSNPNSGQGGVASPRDASANDTIGKKRGRGGTITNGATRRRSVFVSYPLSAQLLIPDNVELEPMRLPQIRLR